MSGKNRFQFEDQEDNTSFRSAPGGPRDDLEYAPADSPVFIDEPNPHQHRRSHFGLWILLGMLVLGIGASTVYYFFYYSKQSEDTTKLDEKFSRIDGTLVDRFFIPEEKASGKLASAIELYRSHEAHRARIAFEEFVASSAPDPEKSIAQTFLGILSLERGRLEMAEHHLLRALKFQPDYLPALVNLSIVMRRAQNHKKALEYAERARSISPADPRVASLMANLLAESQQTEKAIEVYDEAILRAPEDAVHHYNKGLSLLRTSRNDEAILHFAKALEFGEGRVRVLSHSHLAQIYFTRGNFELARHHLEQAVLLSPDDGKYLYNLGVVQLRMNQKRDAVSSFERALQAGSNEPRIFRSLSRAFEQAGQPSRAIMALEKALYLKADDLDTLFALGELYTRQKDYLKAADTLKRIVNITPGDRNTTEALLKLAAVYSRLERPNDAISMLEKARSLQPADIRVYYLLGQVYEKAGQRNLAVAAWKKALQLRGQTDSTDLPVLERDEERQIRLAIGQVYTSEGASELALKEYQIIKQRNKEQPEIKEDPTVDMAMARAYLKLRDYPNAIQSFELATNASSLTTGERKAAYIEMALAYQKQGGSANLDQARASINRAVRMDPLDSDARLMQAAILMETDSLVDREKAIEILKAATSSDLDTQTASKAYNLLGLCYMKNSEFKRALQSFDYAVQLDPGNQQAYRNQRAAANAYEGGLSN